MSPAPNAAAFFIVILIIFVRDALMFFLYSMEETVSEGVLTKRTDRVTGDII